MDKVFMYGFDGLHRVASCYFIKGSNANVRTMDYYAMGMFGEKPNIRTIYAVANRAGLRDDYLDAVVKPHFTKDFEFEDTCATECIRIWRR